MSGAYGILWHGKRVGSVARFAGHPPRERWVAWAPRLEPDKEYTRKFRSRREAVLWLVGLAKQAEKAEEDA